MREIRLYGIARHNASFVTKPRSHRATPRGPRDREKINERPSRELVFLS
jgi:hypothetical protein